VADEGIRGTPGYMAPEQAAGMPATMASDFYAVGVMLFEMLTGNLPFDGRATDMLAEKQRRDAPKVGSTRPEAPRDLAAICDALLSRDATKRPTVERLRAEVSASTRRASPMLGATGGSAQAEESLLGREQELAFLRRAYAEMASGRCVVLFVSGESGIGKSALVDAFVSELRATTETVVLTGRCYERESVPYKAFDAVVDDLSRYLRKLSRENAGDLMPREVFALARLFPVLERVEAVAQAPNKTVADPQDLQQRAFAAFGELLARVRDRRPLMVHFDDFQWADQDSTVFSSHLHRDGCNAWI
jgi:eukaryotic-like serine/threonine-protein kinase